MQLQALLFAFFAAAVPTVSGAALSSPSDSDGAGLLQRDATLTKRTCYPGGVGWGGDKDLALKKVDDACRSMTSGAFQSNEVKHRCHQLSGNKRVNFRIQFDDKPSESISFDTCKTNLRLEIKGCGNGGYSRHGNFVYT